VKYDQLSVEAFGSALLETQDLDPIYVGLNGAKLDDVQRNRWLLAYWCLYDAGSACFMAEQRTAEGFWTYLQAAAMNHEVVPAPIGGRWRRAAERRHWRGENAIKSYAYLRERYKMYPEDMAAYCAQGKGPLLPGMPPETFAAVMKRAQEHVAFGPWIGFKVADMVERCMGVPVSFDEAALALFDSPAEAAAIVYAEKFPGIEPNSKATPLLWSCAYLKDQFKDRKAPPALDRAVGLQEVETILCKWKSHRNGHYPVGNDTAEIRHHLKPWLPHSAIASRFFAALPS